MSGAGSGYDMNSISWSPDGHLFQVEYAAKAVDREPVSIGVRCSDGVLLAAEKPLHSPLLRANSNARIFWISNEVACATVGYRPDCLALIAQARNEDEKHFAEFGVHLSVQALALRLMFPYVQTHIFFQGRPFAASLLLASVVDEPTLYAIEPNGQYYGYLACCFGKDNSVARAELQRIDWGSMTVLDAVPLVAKILRDLHPQSKKWEIEMLWVCKASGGKPQHVPESVFQAAQ
jgi:20S proteasome subunit alpha 7